MGSIVLDAGVVIGYMDDEDAHHKASMIAIGRYSEGTGTFLLPATVLAETLVATIRDRPSQVEQVRSRLATMFGPIRDIDTLVAVEAARVRARYKSIKLPDALVVATAIVEDAEVIVTTDRRLARADRRVRVL